MIRFKDPAPIKKAEPVKPARIKPAAAIVPQPTITKIDKGRGRPKSSNSAPVTIRLDTRIIEHYKAGGAGWQSRINADLLEIAQKK